jgi:hypothetical protein
MESPQQSVQAANFAKGLALWRDRDFNAAADCFAKNAGADVPSARFLERSRAQALRPPGSDWEPILTLEEK